MKLKREDLALYAVTDGRWAVNRTLPEQVEEAILGGATMIQLREKELDYEAFREEARVIQGICKKYGVPFIVNDNVELARELEADGVHVGQSDLAALEARKILGEDKIIGVTAKTVEQAKAAEAAGADYLGSGAVFGTSTKSDAKPMELSLLKEITASVSIPVVAIGGIDESNAHRLKGTGIAGMAVVSGIFAKEDCKKAAEFLRSVEI